MFFLFHLLLWTNILPKVHQNYSDCTCFQITKLIFLANKFTWKNEILKPSPFYMHVILVFKGTTPCFLTRYNLQKIYGLECYRATEVNILALSRKPSGSVSSLFGIQGSRHVTLLTQESVSVKRKLVRSLTCWLFNLISWMASISA